MLTAFASRRNCSYFLPVSALDHPPVTVCCRQGPPNGRYGHYFLDCSMFGNPSMPHFGAGIQMIDGKKCLVLNLNFLPYQCELIANELLHSFGEEPAVELVRHAEDLSSRGVVAGMYPPDDPHIFPKPKDLIYHGVTYPNPHTAGFGSSGHIKHFLYSSVWWGVMAILRDFHTDRLLSCVDMGRLEKTDRDQVYCVVSSIRGIGGIKPPSDSSRVRGSEKLRSEVVHDWCYYNGFTPGIIRQNLENLRDNRLDNDRNCHSTHHAMLEVASFVFDILMGAFGGVEFREPLRSMVGCDRVIVTKPDGTVFPIEGYWKLDGHSDVGLVEKIRLLVAVVREGA